MGTSLIHTSSCFMQCKGITSSLAPSSFIEVLASSANDRRIYGFAMLSDDNAAQTVRISLTSGGDRILAVTVNVAAGSGTNGTVAATDVFGGTNGQSIFQKKRDTNGLAYFDLTAGWSIEIQYFGGLTNETLTTHIFGETY